MVIASTSVTTANVGHTPVVSADGHVAATVIAVVSIATMVPISPIAGRCGPGGAGFGTCRLGSITVWLPVRVCANPEFPVSAEHPRFSAVWGGCNGPFAVSVGNEGRSEADWGPSSLTSEIRFPVRGEGPARDSVRMRQRPVCISNWGRTFRLRAETGLHARDSSPHSPDNALSFGV